MKIFVTGASGWIGSAVVEELMANGHQVMGLGRSEASIKTLEKAGVEVVHGSLDDLDVLRNAAKTSDGVIHLAFKHDLAFSGNFQGAADADRKAVEVFGEALAGSDKPLVIASGLLGGKPGQLFTEADGHDGTTVNATGPAVRHATAEYVLSLADKGVRSAIVRLAPTNHGEGDNGFMAAIVKIAQDTGVAGYIGDGSQRWPAIHRLDSAHLFCLAIEKAPAGSTLHGSAEEGIAIKDIAEAIGQHLNIPTKSIAPEDAGQHFTWLGNFLMLDSPASNEATGALLDWQPTHPTLIQDLNQDFYYKQ